MAALDAESLEVRRFNKCNPRLRPFNSLRRRLPSSSSSLQPRRQRNLRLSSARSSAQTAALRRAVLFSVEIAEPRIEREADEFGCNVKLFCLASVASPFCLSVSVTFINEDTHSLLSSRLVGARVHELFGIEVIPG